MLTRILAKLCCEFEQVPLSERIEGRFDAYRFAKIEPDLVIINVGRGLVIDEVALYAALV